jgi:hypothetical protein
MGFDTSFQQFVESLNDFNRHLFYFLLNNPNSGISTKSLKFWIKLRLGILSEMKQWLTLFFRFLMRDHFLIHALREHGKEGRTNSLDTSSILRNLLPVTKPTLASCGVTIVTRITTVRLTVKKFIS